MQFLILFCPWSLLDLETLRETCSDFAWRFPVVDLDFVWKLAEVCMTFRFPRVSWFGLALLSLTSSTFLFTLADLNLRPCKNLARKRTVSHAFSCGDHCPWESRREVQVGVGGPAGQQLNRPAYGRGRHSIGSWRRAQNWQVRTRLEGQSASYKRSFAFPAKGAI